jgi:hypothetical protein
MSVNNSRRPIQSVSIVNTCRKYFELVQQYPKVIFFPLPQHILQNDISFEEAAHPEIRLL